LNTMCSYRIVVQFPKVDLWLTEASWAAAAAAVAAAVAVAAAAAVSRQVKRVEGVEEGGKSWKKLGGLS